MRIATVTSAFRLMSYTQGRASLPAPVSGPPPCNEPTRPYRELILHLPATNTTSSPLPQRPFLLFCPFLFATSVSYDLHASTLQTYSSQKAAPKPGTKLTTTTTTFIINPHSPHSSPPRPLPRPPLHPRPRPGYPCTQRLHLRQHQRSSDPDSTSLFLFDTYPHLQDKIHN